MLVRARGAVPTLRGGPTRPTSAVARQEGIRAVGAVGRPAVVVVLRQPVASCSVVLEMVGWQVRHDEAMPVAIPGLAIRGSGHYVASGAAGAA